MSANSLAARASEAADCTDWPTMMIDSSTSCRNVCAIQATMMMTWPELIAAGRLISAIAANT